MSQQLIDFYKAIENSSQQMLAAAKVEDWDQVARYEGVCAVLIEQLRLRAQTEELAPAVRREKGQIMQRILSIDAEIRCLTEPVLDQVEHHLGRTSQYLH